MSDRVSDETLRRVYVTGLTFAQADAVARELLDARARIAELERKRDEARIASMTKDSCSDRESA